MLAMHWDQNIIFIIIAAIVGISRLIARISEESKKRSQRPPQLPRAPSRPEYTQPVQRTQPKTDADRIREFLEALGQPAGTAPPKVQPRTADSAATARTSSTSSIDAAIPEARIPHLEGTGEGDRGAATAYRTCASQNQARRCPVCSSRSE